MSIFGIPCHVRNGRFLEAVISNIGIIVNFEFLDSKLKKLDVVTFMVFTNSLEKIRSKVNVCVDGAWNTLMIVEEEAQKNSLEGNSSGDASFATDFETDSVSLEGSRRKVFEEDIGASTGDSIPQKPETCDGDVSSAGRLYKEKSVFSSEKRDMCCDGIKCINCCFTVPDISASRVVPSPSDSILDHSFSSVECSLGAVFSSKKDYDVAFQVGPAGICIKPKCLVDLVRPRGSGP